MFLLSPSLNLEHLLLQNPKRNLRKNKKITIISIKKNPLPIDKLNKINRKNPLLSINKTVPEILKILEVLKPQAPTVYKKTTAELVETLEVLKDLLMDKEIVIVTTIIIVIIIILDPLWDRKMYNNSNNLINK